VTGGYFDSLLPTGLQLHCGLMTPVTYLVVRPVLVSASMLVCTRRHTLVLLGLILPQVRY
jgi:hypothetical protein